ncbi:IS3 family transposase [Arthrobacter sp. LAPM80]|uniref:IS3 family transposase n=1 Tax=Arthrobacter sp. LAPM80 TaxID=3141788 RepID=UPI00398B99D8
MEHFFGLLKEEMSHRQEFTDTDGFLTELEDYIHWYGHDRIPLTLHRLVNSRSTVRGAVHFSSVGAFVGTRNDPPATGMAGGRGIAALFPLTPADSEAFNEVFSLC